MFKKDNSSFSKDGKKETSLRKSDLRKLLSAFKAFHNIGKKSFNGDDVEEEEKLNDFLNHIFTLPSSSNNAQDAILKRKIPSHTNVWLYLRTPTTTTVVAASDENDSSRASWPYNTANNNNINQPLLLEMESASNSKKKLLIPCLALLSVLPDLLPIVHVYSETSKFLCRGADLMKGGVLGITISQSSNDEKQKTLRKGSLVSICVIGNSQPFAVGFLAEDSNHIQRNDKGVAVEIVTCYGDDLWKSQVGNVKNNDNNEEATLARNFFNPGFINGHRVYPLEKETGEKSESDEEDRSNTDDVAVVNQDNDGNNNNDSQSEREEQLNDQQQERQQTEQEMQDELLIMCFMKAIIMPQEPLTNLDKNPIPVSVFYAKHILAARPPDVTLDLKKTSYKKIGIFLLKQAEIGLIELRASKDKKDKVAFISGINKSHEAFRQVKKELLKDSSNNIMMNNLSSNKNKQKSMVVNLYCIPAHFTKLLRLNPDDVNATNAKSEARKGTGFLTLPEAREILNQYLVSNELIDKSGFDPESVELDGPLLDTIYKKSKKDKAAAAKNNNTVTSTSNILKTVTRKEIMEKWIEKIDTGHAIVQMPGNKIVSMKRGPPEKIKIEVSKRPGNNKFITKVRGLEMYVESFSGDLFAKDVARRFACAGAVETTPVKGGAALKKGCVELVFQGHLLEEITALLMGGNTKICSHGGVKDSPYIVPKGIIESKVGKGIPKKKKRG